MPDKPALLFCVRLVFGARALESGKLEARGVGRDNLRKFVERHLQAPGIGDLRNEANVGHRNLRAAAIGSGRHQRFEGIETFNHPMMIPGVDCALLLAHLVLEIAQQARRC